MTQLQKAREKANLSRQELATKAGITAKSCWNIENRKVARVQDRIRKGIVAALGVRHSALFSKFGGVK